MASYGLRYFSNIKNNLNENITCNIYKKNYSDVSTRLISSGLKIEYNADENFGQILTNGCEFNFVNNFTNFNSINELAYAKNDEFKIEVVNKDTSVMLFEGYIENDIMELSLAKNGNITLQFSDNINKLEKYEPSINVGNDNMVTLIEYIRGCLVHTKLEYPIYVNNSLYYNSAIQGDTSTFLEQTYVDPLFFQVNSLEQKDSRKTLKDLLKPFNSVLYAYNQKWIIERYDDIDSSYRSYRKFDFSNLACSSVNNMYNTISLEKDFEYINNSQRAQVTAALNTIDLRLEDKKYDSLVLNNYDQQINKIATYNYGAYASNLKHRTWYYDASLGYWPDPSYYLALPPYKFGTGYYGLTGKYIWFNRPFSSIDEILSDASEGMHRGIYCKFKHGINADELTNLNISWKSADDINWGTPELENAWQERYIRWFLRRDDDKYLYPDASGLYHCGTNRYVFEDKMEYDDTFALNFSKSINVTDCSNGKSVLSWVLGICPVKHIQYNAFYPNGMTTYSGAYVSDVKISANSKNANNLISATLNEEFLNKKSDSLSIFDCDNYTYKNALYRYGTNTGLPSGSQIDFYPTSNWTQEDISTWIPPYEAQRSGLIIYKTDDQIYYVDASTCTLQEGDTIDNSFDYRWIAIIDKSPVSYWTITLNDYFPLNVDDYMTHTYTVDGSVQHSSYYTGSIQKQWLNSMFKYYNQPRKTLNANIQMKNNNMLKPLSIIYDSTQTDPSNNISKFVLKNYTFDPATNRYNIKAIERPNDIINII